MPKNDLVYAGHMLDSSRRAVAKLAGKERAEFDSDDTLQLATVHLVQIVGEAARMVSVEFRQQHPEIPWSEITGMRHRIVHEYFDVDLAVVWDVLTQHLPILILQLNQIVPDVVE